MKYRVVPGSLWADPKFRKLSPDQKLVLLHLITGPHSNVSGLFCLPLLYIAHETALSNDEVRGGIDALITAGYVRWDEPTETIWVVGMLEYQGGSSKILKAVADQVESLPRSAVVDAFRAHYAQLQIPYRYPIDRVSSKDKEQEKEEERAEDGAPISADCSGIDGIPYTDIIAYLNEKTGKRFRPSTEKYRTAIRARWRDCYRFDDFRRVIDIKVAEWASDPKMQSYLRPQTLFGSNFDSYLNSGPAAPAPVGEAYQPFKEDEREFAQP